MTKRVCIAVLLISMAFGQALLAEEFTPDKNTLFLAHYNTDIAPDYSRVSREVKGFASLTSDKGGFLGEALIVKDVMCTNPEGLEMLYKAPVYRANGNYSSAQGTIELWVKMESSWEEIGDSAYRNLVTLCEWREGQEFASGHVSLICNKGEGPIAKKVAFTEETRVVKDGKLMPADQKEWAEVYRSRFHLDADISSWKKGEWHHIAATWDAKKNERALFIDGAKAASGESNFDDKTFVPRAADLMVGGLFYKSQSISCIMDEVRISDIVRYSDHFEIKK